jgi:predicted transcriptional regulator of viral defense system
MTLRSMTLTNKMLLNARNMAETVISYIKALSSLNLRKHGPPANVFIHVTAYQLNLIQTQNYLKIIAS